MDVLNNPVGKIIENFNELKVLKEASEVNFSDVRRRLPVYKT